MVNDIEVQETFSQEVWELVMYKMMDLVYDYFDMREGVENAIPGK